MSPQLCDKRCRGNCAGKSPIVRSRRAIIVKVSHASFPRGLGRQVFRIMRIIALRVLLAIVAGCSVPLLAAAGQIEMVLATSSGFPATSTNDWYRMLVGLGVSELQIRQATVADKPQIETSGSEADPSYKITGLLTSRNELVLPGGRFSSRDSGGLRAWLDKLRNEGAARAGRPAIGLWLYRRAVGKDPRRFGSAGRHLHAGRRASAAARSSGASAHAAAGGPGRRGGLAGRRPAAGHGTQGSFSRHGAGVCLANPWARADAAHEPRAAARVRRAASDGEPGRRGPSVGR